jgi:hypothetical protein
MMIIDPLNITHSHALSLSLSPNLFLTSICKTTPRERKVFEVPAEGYAGNNYEGIPRGTTLVYKIEMLSFENLPPKQPVH